MLRAWAGLPDPFVVFSAPNFFLFSFGLRFRQDPSAVSVPEAVLTCSQVALLLTRRPTGVQTGPFATEEFGCTVRALLSRRTWHGGCERHYAGRGQASRGRATKTWPIDRARTGSLRVAGRQAFCTWCLPTMSKARGGSPASNSSPSWSRNSVSVRRSIDQRACSASRFGIPRFRSHV